MCLYMGVGPCSLLSIENSIVNTIYNVVETDSVVFNGYLTKPCLCLYFL